MHDILDDLYGRRARDRFAMRRDFGLISGPLIAGALAAGTTAAVAASSQKKPPVAPVTPLPDPASNSDSKKAARKAAEDDAAFGQGSTILSNDYTGTGTGRGVATGSPGTATGSILGK